MKRIFPHHHLIQDKLVSSITKEDFEPPTSAEDEVIVPLYLYHQKIGLKWKVNVYDTRRIKNKS